MMVQGKCSAPGTAGCLELTSKHAFAYCPRFTSADSITMTVFVPTTLLTNPQRSKTGQAPRVLSKVNSAPRLAAMPSTPRQQPHKLEP